jgi:hypothetical protein
MSNKEWDEGTVDQKLEMLRQDITNISEAHNRVSRDLVDLLGRVAELERRHPKNEALSSPTHLPNS